MKITNLQFKKLAIFLKFIKNLLDGFYVMLMSIFAINKDIIELQNQENLKFFF